MCTLIALHRSLPGAPLVIAANRDEFLDRPAEALAIRDLPAGPALLPLDLKAGGTWLGLNARGVFAAVTNRRCPDPDPNRRSRGLIVTDALSARSAEEAGRMLAALPAENYNPFNAFVADRERAFALVYQGAGTLRELAPGAHVIGNADPDDRAVPKVARVLEQAEKAATLPRHRVLEALESSCREHDCGDGELGDTCVHRGPYGTRSSLLLLMTEPEDQSELYYADGPPCTTPFDNFTPLLTELSQRARYGTGEPAPRNAS